jgi:hypothetical protein
MRAAVHASAAAAGVSCSPLQLRHHTCCCDVAAAWTSSCSKTSEPAPATAPATAAGAAAILSAWQQLQQHVQPYRCVQLWCQRARVRHCLFDTVFAAWRACVRGVSAVACVMRWYKALTTGLHHKWGVCSRCGFTSPVLMLFGRWPQYMVDLRAVEQ